MMTVTPGSSGLGIMGSIKVCPGPICLTSLFLFLKLSHFSVSAVLCFVSKVGISAWEFSHCGFGCGLQRQRRTLLLAVSQVILPMAGEKHLWESH